MARDGPELAGTARNSPATLRGIPENGLTGVSLCTNSAEEEASQLTQSRITISIHEGEAAAK